MGIAIAGEDRPEFFMRAFIMLSGWSGKKWAVTFLAQVGDGFDARCVIDSTFQKSRMRAQLFQFPTLSPGELLYLWLVCRDSPSKIDCYRRPKAEGEQYSHPAKQGETLVLYILA
jgi:hypothetical protein